MITALVLLTVIPDKVTAVAEQLADMPGVTEVYSIAGRFDLAVVIRVKENDQLATIVSDKIRQVKGIQTSETLIAFRVFSRYDLEMAFSLGSDEEKK